MGHKYAMFLIDIGIGIEGATANNANARPEARERSLKRIAQLTESKNALARDAAKQRDPAT